MSVPSLISLKKHAKIISKKEFISLAESLEKASNLAGFRNFHEAQIRLKVDRIKLADAFMEDDGDAMDIEYLANFVTKNYNSYSEYSDNFIPVVSTDKSLLLSFALTQYIARSYRSVHFYSTSQSFLKELDLFHKQILKEAKGQTSIPAKEEVTHISFASNQEISEILKKSNEGEVYIDFSGCISEAKDINELIIEISDNLYHQGDGSYNFLAFHVAEKDLKAVENAIIIKKETSKIMFEIGDSLFEFNKNRFGLKQISGKEFNGLSQALQALTRKEIMAIQDSQGRVFKLKEGLLLHRTGKQWILWTPNTKEMMDTYHSLAI